MTGTETIFKDILEVHRRLFEHKAVLQGDVNFFVREFEEKRGERDVTRIRSIQQNLETMTDVHFPSIEDMLSTHSQNVNSKMGRAVEMCDKIGSKEGTIETEFLRQQRETRAMEWSDFMKSQFEKSAEVDRDFDKELKLAEKQYADLEEKLKLQTP